MIKLLFVGDNHIDDHIRTRKGDYLQDSLDELEECLEIARAEKCDACVFLGDIFNRINISPYGRNKVLNSMKSFNDVRKLVCVGNHDIHHNPSLLKKSDLYTLIRSGALELHDFVPELGLGFVHFEPKVEEVMKNGGLLNAPYPIIVAHASIATQTTFGDYILFDDLLLHPETKLVVAGHIHLPMHQVRSDGVTFHNPGNVGRNAATIENMTRDIKVTLVSYDLKEGISDLRTIKLLSSKPAEEVFHLDAIKQEKAYKRAKTQFMQEINKVDFNTVRVQDRSLLLKQFAEETKVPPEVLNRVQQAIEEVRLQKGG